MSHDVLVVGDVMTDVIVRPHGPPVRGSDCAATIRPSPGGSGANQAAWMGHLGARVAFAGRAGAADAAAQAQALQAHGVATHLAVDATLPTGLLVALLDADGERSFLTDRGANAALCRDDLPHRLLDGARLLHVSGYSLFTPAPREAVLDLIRAARGRGLAVTLDAGSAGFIAGGGADFLSWARDADTLFANADEAEALCGSSDLAVQLARLTQHFATVVVKRGAAGAVAAKQDGRFVEAAAPAIAALDTTGAGDAFLAGFVLAWLVGLDLAACLDAGVRQGAVAAAMPGGRPPRRVS